MKHVEWWSAQRPARGETVCGDAVSVVEVNESILVAVADGLGHGPHAAEASRGFCGVVERYGSLPLRDVMTLGAEAIACTRGAAAALLRLDRASGTGSFLGIGNIELRALAHPPISVVSRAGIV